MKEKYSFSAMAMVLACCYMCVSGSEWIDVKNSSHPKPVQLSKDKKLPNSLLKVEGFDSIGILLEKKDLMKTKKIKIKLDIGGYIKETRIIKNETYSYLKTVGWHNTLEVVGKPLIPVKRIMVEIPLHTQPEVKMSHISEVTIRNIVLHHAQDIIIYSDTSSIRTFTKDKVSCQTNRPSRDKYLLNYKVVGMRNHRVLVIDVALARVNPSMKMALAVENMELEVNLKGSKSLAGSLPASRAFDKQYKK